MGLRIAFDLDGVLADMGSALATHAEALFGAGTSGGADREGTSPPITLNLTPRQRRRLWERVQAIPSFWETLAEHEPGAVARLAAIAADRRWELIFLTKRPRSAGPTAQVQSQRWLEAKGFRLPSVFVVQGSRGRIAAALGLDVVVDDRLENCLDVKADSKARAILVWRDQGQLRLPASARRLGIGVVKSVAECLEVLSEIKAPVERSTLRASVMRAFSMSDKKPGHSSS